MEYRKIKDSELSGSKHDYLNIGI